MYCIALGGFSFEYQKTRFDYLINPDHCSSGMYNSTVPWNNSRSYTILHISSRNYLLPHRNNGFCFKDTNQWLETIITNINVL